MLGPMLLLCCAALWAFWAEDKCSTSMLMLSGPLPRTAKLPPKFETENGPQRQANPSTVFSLAGREALASNRARGSAINAT